MSGHNGVSTRHRESRIVDFDGLIQGYMETKSILGSIKTKNNEKHGNNLSGGTMAMNFVVPSAGDFVADVEIQARRALILNGNRELYKLFMEVYGSENAPAEYGVCTEKLFEIRWRVGAELKKNMLPIHSYLKGRMVKRAN